MKTFYSTLFARTFALAIAAACATSGEAIDGLDSIKVSAAQMQWLGIQTVTLRDPATGSKTSYPARVVVPAAAQQVVSAPVRGVITQVLVQPY